MASDLFRTLTTLDNLELALVRINTSMNTSYKQFFRPVLQMYNLNAKENLKDLQQKLRSHSYEPYNPIKIYTPKPSGLQRPITLLSIEDQILLQAIANIYANSLFPTFSKLIGHTTFSNWPQKKGSIFFLYKWQYSFNSYHTFLKRKYLEGNNWVVKFDLASFFDTIDHELLIKVLCRKNSNRIFQSEVKRWLSCWTSENSRNQYSHGIPQGPTGSGFLAECFMLSIDKFLLGKIIYARYVDDIRLLGEHEIHVRKALVELDKQCRDKGLIPNVDKTGIKEVKSYEEFVSDLPTLFPYFEYFDLEKWSLKQIVTVLSEAIAVENGTYKIIDKSKFRYVLFRAQASDYLLDLVLNIWSLYPENTDAFVSFIVNNYSRNNKIIAFCKSLLTYRYPYDFVRGELWKLLARFGTQEDLKPLIDLAINSIKEKGIYSAERIGIYSFLLSCERLGLGRYSNWITNVDSSILLTQVEPYLDLSVGGCKNVVREISNRHLIDPWLVLCQKLRDCPNSINTYSIDIGKIPIPVQRTLKKIGIISLRTKPQRDLIGIYLTKHFNVSPWKGWKKLLENEYVHAWNLLDESDLYFTGFSSAWLTQIDSFNDCIFRCFITLLGKKGAPGSINTTNSKGELISYGSLIKNYTFTHNFPTLSKNLLIVHSRRISLPEAHPYSLHTGDRNKPLKSYERNYFVNIEKQVIDEFLKESMKLGVK